MLTDICVLLANKSTTSRQADALRRRFDYVERGERLVVFGRRGPRRRRREMSDAANCATPAGTERCPACERRARGDGGGDWRRRAVDVTPRLSTSVGANALLLILLPHQTALDARLERHGGVEADGQEGGEEQAAKLHAVIVPGASGILRRRARYSAASR